MMMMMARAPLSDSESADSELEVHRLQDMLTGGHAMGPCGPASAQRGLARRALALGWAIQWRRPRPASRGPARLGLSIWKVSLPIEHVSPKDTAS
jgi:hypothetical protein